MIKTDLQLFAEGEETNNETGTEAQEKAKNVAPAQGGEAKTFSADYVHDLREESKAYRQTAKNYETALRKALNVGDGEELGDIDKRISRMQSESAKAVNDAMATANARLIQAEIKGLEGYDEKLLKKVMDFSKITVEADGTVKGVKEAAEEAAKEYPAVKQAQPPKYNNGTGKAPVGGEKYGPDVLAFRQAAGLKID